MYATAVPTLQRRARLQSICYKTQHAVHASRRRRYVQPAALTRRALQATVTEKLTARSAVTGQQPNAKCLALPPLYLSLPDDTSETSLTFV